MHATIVRNTAIATAAVGALIAAGVAASVSPEFKQHATTTGIVLLGLLALTGIVARLVLRQLDTRHTLSLTAQRLAGEADTAVSGAHTGSVR